MRTRQGNKDRKLLAEKQAVFYDTMDKTTNESARLALIHSQIDWCHRTMAQHHDDKKLIQYCCDWLSVLNDALSSVA